MSAQTDLQTAITNYRRGGFKRFRLSVADDNGWGRSELVGGFDTLAEAQQAAREITAECDRLISEGWVLSSDPEYQPYFWIKDNGTEVFAGSGYMLPGAR